MEIDFLKYGSFLLAIITAAKGIWEYSKAQKFKKIELLDKLINEFESDRTLLARQLLDDFWIEDNSGNIIKYSNLSHVLRNHRPDGISDEIEREVRASFDKLFDFLSKLHYLLYLGLINKKDLYYFEYYLSKIFESEACINYAKTYGSAGILKLYRNEIGKNY